MINNFGKVVVLMGGSSAEREISLQTGQEVFAALQRKGIQVTKIDAVGNYVDKLINGKFDRAFIALHGSDGEGGIVQGLLEALNIPYTGSSVLGSALGLDKIRSKQIWQNLKLPTPKFCVWHDTLHDALEVKLEVKQVIDLLGLPLSVKPATEGSSIGITKVTEIEQFLPACEKAKRYGQVLIEQWITGEEYTVGILGDQILPSILIKSKESFYDYTAKYLSEETQYICPSPLNDIEEKQIKTIALAAFKAISASGWGRVDFIRDLNGNFWILEVNTVPGLTSHSLIPSAVKAIGIAFDDLILKILSQTLEAVNTDNTEKLSYENIVSC